jgi:oligopeptide/dipeptide ABC transporter ATP-binding protein
MIAMALALEPELIIADEPTTALDATVQAQILDLLGRLRDSFGTALVVITHDLGVVADIADEVLVMYAGRVVESAGRRPIYYEPHHPYTKGLLESIPGAAGTSGALRPIPGQPPSMIAVPAGCAFHPRCRYVMDRCQVDLPDLHPVGAGHRSACWLPGRLLGFGDEVEAERVAAAREVGT